MTQTTPERKQCSVCPGEYTVTANGTIRHHTTDKPEFQAGPDSRKCKGAGEPPAGAGPEALTTAGSQCRLCRHPVQITGNGRARSHLTPEATPRPCPGGSDFPLGTYPDMVGTTDGLVATLAFDCEHREVGACHDCYAAEGDKRFLQTLEDTGFGGFAQKVRDVRAKAGQVQMARSDADHVHEPGTDEYGATACIICGLVVAERPSAPWGVDPAVVFQPTMADQLKAAPFTEAPERETQGVGTVLDTVDDDTRAEAERFMDATPEPLTGGPMLRARLAALVTTDYRTPEQKAQNARTSELTREVVKVLEQRSPEEKAETAARMDRTASAALGVPLDPALNHNYTDPSGTVWTHPGPVEACQAPDCTVMRSSDPHAYEAAVAIATVDADRAEENRQHAETLADVHRRAYPGGAYCEQCDTDTHRCPGCGTDVPHGTVACAACTARVDAEDAERKAKCTHPHGFIENDPVDDDGEGLVFRCGECGAVGIGDKPVGPDPELPNCPHPETHRAGCGCPDDDSRDSQARGVDATIAALEAEQVASDGWRTPADTVRDLMPEEIRGLDALRLNCATCGHPVTPLVDQFDLYGKAKAVAWGCADGIRSGYRVCRDHECAPNRNARLGDLDEGDHFIRRGTLMRLTERESASSVLAEVMDGPHKGRTGELKNLDEMVERAPATEPTTEQETKECTATPQTSRLSSSEPVTPTTTSPTTAPAPGSPRATRVSAPAVSPKSESVTPSAPTARAAGNGGSAAVTTDQASAAAAFFGSGRPAATQATGAPSQTDAAAQFLAGGSGAHGEKETKRDRFGRYLIPHPDTGKEKAWTRSTTFAKSISDTYALSQWGLRMALLGATVRPDIVQRAHGKHVKQDKQLLDELTADLKTAAGDKVAANLGTSMHSFTEMADRAWHSPGGPRSILNQVPEEAREMVETYIRLLEETGLEPVPHLIEFTTVVKQYGVAGTSDNCYKVTKPLTLKIGRAEVQFAPGDYTIGDKKTGRDLDYGWQEIAIQLSTYAQGTNTAGVWDRHEERWEPDPLNGAKVRTDAGIVIHLPVDKESEKTPTVYGIDLESGWNAAVLCERVRAWRKVRNLASPVMVSEAETFAPTRPEPAVTTRTTVRPPSLRDRANAVTSKTEASAVWQAARTDGLTDTEVDELVKIMQARLAELAEPGG